MEYMTRKTLLLGLLMALSTIVCGQKREVHILAVNDVHAAIEGMPQLVAIADSLRAIYPSLLVFSAGDNRTGNPLNDLYEPAGYPMVALLNLAGCNASALGNHEFDANSLPPPLRAVCLPLPLCQYRGRRLHGHQYAALPGIRRRGSEGRRHRRHTDESVRYARR